MNDSYANSAMGLFMAIQNIEDKAVRKEVLKSILTTLSSAFKVNFNMENLADIYIARNSQSYNSLSIRRGERALGSGSGVEIKVTWNDPNLKQPVKKLRI